ncbi:MAG: DUF1579 family protein [Candidatus Hydrogenedentes bacterium]|nr:DUF1579 family protein [Candidatus Hydrogenedentota bacterium]
MRTTRLFVFAAVAVTTLVVITGSIAVAAPSGEKSAEEQPAIPLPPGWTEEDMQACMLAGTPGPMHEFLAEGVGEWRAKTTMWMAPGTEPMVSEGESTVKTIMNGHYTQAEMSGETPGMGPYSALAIYGFDNVQQKFVATWVDTMSTGIGSGVGELSPDGKTLTWVYTYSCPVTKKPAVIREIETITGPDTKTVESFGTNPKTGEEFQMMRLELTRKH